jgi:hypothetical protein
MAVYGSVRHQKNIIWTSEASYGPQKLRSYNIFLVTYRSIYCHMTLSAKNYLLFVCLVCIPSFYFRFINSGNKDIYMASNRGLMIYTGIRSRNAKTQTIQWSQNDNTNHSQNRVNSGDQVYDKLNNVGISCAYSPGVFSPV